MRVAVFFLSIACILLAVLACEPDQTHNGCKIYGNACTCGFGCRTEFNYRSRRACMNALRERSSNVCSRFPCLRGICIQTVQDPGFACKCEGTGFYGQRCEKERSSNVCSRFPCLRGICIQTVQDPGFACKCEGTGFYGQRCEKACPSVAIRGMIFPHECIVI